ncbi:MAG TPA: VTT domain-containing protein [Phycisphaerae bacterium]|nr:VTT domain-containing protein [Phycisphaerae bacterium]
MSDKPPSRSPTGVTDEIIESEIQVHWTARAMRPVRRLYEWVLGWAETKYAGVALGALAFSEAIFFPVPADVLLIALCLGRPKRSFRWAAICTFASILGGMAAWLLGAYVGEPALRCAMQWIGYEAKMDLALAKFSEHGFLAVAVSALTPVPYMVFSWVAGASRFPLWQFALSSIIFRPMRFFAVAGLVYAFGPRAKHFIDKYFNLVTVAFMVLVIGVVVLVKLLRH